MNQSSDVVDAVLCIGSNVPEAEGEIAAAIEALSRFGVVNASPTYRSGSGYSNSVARLATTLSLDALTAETKAIELLLGRNPEARAEGRVPVDIDIVIYDGAVIRPADAAAAYFTVGLEMLKNANHIACRQK